MAQPDLEQSANVLWLPEIAQRGAFMGGETRPFSRLEDAVRFVMEELPSDVRSTAWITIDGPSLTFEDIERLYQTLPPAD